MRSFTIIILLAAFGTAHGTELATNQPVDSQDFTDQFVNKLANKLIDRAVGPLQDADLDDTTLGKSAGLAAGQTVSQAKPAVFLRPPGLVASTLPRLMTLQAPAFQAPAFQAPAILSFPSPSRGMVVAHVTKTKTEIKKENLARRKNRNTKDKMKKKLRKVKDMTWMTVGETQELKDALSAFYSAADKAARKHVIHPNKAARLKSRAKWWVKRSEGRTELPDYMPERLQRKMQAKSA